MKCVIDLAFAGGTLFSLIRQIMYAIQENREQAFFWWGVTMTLIVFHMWIVKEMEKRL